MLRIRQEQVDALNDQADESFARKLVTILREGHADAVAGLAPDVLLARVGKGIVRARSHGLDFASSIASFVALMFEVGPRFDEHPDIRAALLAAAGVDGDPMAEVLDAVELDAWIEAGARRDEGDW
jgi:hypothetical protein